MQHDKLKVLSPAAVTSNKPHILKIYKATEVRNGIVAFGGLRAVKLHDLPRATIANGRGTDSFLCDELGVKYGCGENCKDTYLLNIKLTFSAG